MRVKMSNVLCKPRGKESELFSDGCAGQKQKHNHKEIKIAEEKQILSNEAINNMSLIPIYDLLCSCKLL